MVEEEEEEEKWPRRVFLSMKHKKNFILFVVEYFIQTTTTIEQNMENVGMKMNKQTNK